MPLTRRQFLKRSGAVSGALLGSAAAPSLFASPALADLLGPLDRYFVILYLGGGNDGLNTIVPVDDIPGVNLRTHYETHRGSGGGGLRIPQAQLAVPSSPFLDPGSGTQLGFHPGLAEVAALYDQGRVAVIQGCGYPDYNLSHDESTTAWATGNPAGVPSLSGTGVVGRHLAAEYTGSDIPAVIVRSGPAQEFRQTATNVLNISRLAKFSFPNDDYDPADVAVKEAVYQSLYADPFGGQPGLAFVGAAGTATFQAVQSFAPLHAAYEADRSTFSSQYAAVGSLGRRFREVAKVIYGMQQGTPGINVRFFHVRKGGFDTHSNQGAGAAGGQHFDLFQQVGRSLQTFYDDLEDMGAANKVVTLVWSEFSRRIPQNKNGTDHGSQGPMLVIGGDSAGTGPVQGGAYGNHPNIDPLALDNQENTPYSQAPLDPFRSTDFRDVYGTVFKHWMTVPESTILGSLLALDTGDPNTYWTANDFDLGFL